MKNRLLKTFTSLVLTVLMVISVMPAFAITIGAADVNVTLTKDEISDIADLELDPFTDTVLFEKAKYY